MMKNKSSGGGPSHIKLGQKGEDQAVRFLENQGYKILARNFRSAKTEIDIAARDGDTLVIVEVKSFHSPPLGAAEFRVNKAKRKQLQLAAQLFLAEHQEFAGMDVRFDVIIVDFSRWPAQITHHREAFWAEDYWDHSSY